MSLSIGAGSPCPLEIFKELTAIPRASGDEKAIADALIEFAAARKLEWKRDAANNVLIKKPGSAGRERHAPIILQAHMDMVYVKAPDAPHEYGKPLSLRAEGDILTAKGTSLGADNGAGMALTLAALVSDGLEHPPIEALFTANEENGLIGASQLTGGWLEGRTLLNIDGEAERSITAGCAGAFRAELRIPVTKVAAEDRAAMRLRVTGLHGGHSGLDIHRGRGSANVLMGRLLWLLAGEAGILLESVNGGSHMNTIPTEAEAVIRVRPEELLQLQIAAAKYGAELAGELTADDAGFACTLEPCEAAGALDAESTERVLRACLLMPNGVMETDRHDRSRVQTSTNLGMIRTGEDCVRFISNPRSSSDSQLQWMRCRLSALAAALDGELAVDSAYPPWEYAEKSAIRQSWLAAYRELYGGELEVDVLHGGLEPGWFARLYPGMDMITVGPDILGAHSVKEELHTDSLGRIWNVLLRVLAQI